jgi:6-phosphogluconate dehydrogenase
MQIGFVGLGRMGANMVKRLLERGGHEVVAYDVSAAAVDRVAQAGAAGVHSLADLARALRPPRAIWIMVPAGDPVDQTLQSLIAVCEPGDLFADGGNSNYKDSLRRAQEVATHSCELLDVGTSGGIWGRELGYALMVGGSAEGFARLEPALRTLAPEGGYAHVGPSGAGHFAKMVHNGVEYALMQSYAEGFALLEQAPFDYDLATVARVWNNGGVVRSWLLELVRDALEKDPRLESVGGYVEDTGYGRWTVQAAIEMGVPAPVIMASLFTRFRSRQDEPFAERLLAILRQQFGGHAVRAQRREMPSP